MFCSQCGKEVFGNIPLCEDCQSKQNDTFYVEPEKVYDTRSADGQEETIHIVEPQCENSYEEQSKNPRLLGFPGALASVIVGYIAMIANYFASYLILTFSTLEATTGVDKITFAFVLGIVASIISIPLTLVPLTLAIKSILTFKNAKSKKPIATLILGIVGLDISAAAALFMLFVFALTGLLFIFNISGASLLNSFYF